MLRRRDGEPDGRKRPASTRVPEAAPLRANHTSDPSPLRREGPKTPPDVPTSSLRGGAMLGIVTVKGENSGGRQEALQA